MRDRTEVTIAIPFYSGLEYLRSVLDSFRATDVSRLVGDRRRRRGTGS